MITTVNELKIGDRISFVDHERCWRIMTILEMTLTSTRDFEWINPWLPTEPVVLCYRMKILADDFPNDPWIHRYTLDYRLYKHEDAPTEPIGFRKANNDSVHLFCGQS